MLDSIRFVLAGALLAACSAAPARNSYASVDETWASPSATVAPDPAASAIAAPATQSPPRSSPKPPKWMPGAWLMQGFVGANSLTKAETTVGDVTVDAEGDLDMMPVIGGGGQVKLGGDKVDFGLETMFSIGWQGDVQAFAVGGGGAAVAVDVDLLLFEVYGGPFASMFLGDKLRVYGSAGPLAQFADYEQSGNLIEDSGSGFGFGYYGRLGLEFALPSRMWIGIGARWSDTEIDLDGGLGDFDAEGYQFVITFSRF